MGSDRADKICAVCGRPFAWRKRWARVWAEVRYCSDRCRRQRASRVDTRLERAILELLDLRPPGTRICPSEAARRVRATGWRELMNQTRNAARRLAAQGRVEITQRGRVVDPAGIRGPVRLRKPA